MYNVKLIKKINPEGGIAKTPLEILERSRKLLEDDGKWVQGELVCARVSSDLSPEEREQRQAEVVEDIMRNGLCGGGWGVCALGAASLTAGLNAIVEIDGEFFDHKSRDYTRDVRKKLTSLVDEGGTAHYAKIEPPAVRVKRYKKAHKLLAQATSDVTGGASSDIVGINDGEGGFDEPSDAHKRVLDIFDRAIQLASE